MAGIKVSVYQEFEVLLVALWWTVAFPKKNTPENSHFRGVCLKVIGCFLPCILSLFFSAVH